MRRNPPEECPTNLDVALFELTTPQEKRSQKTVEIRAMQKSLMLPQCFVCTREQLERMREGFQPVAVIFPREDVIGLPETFFL